MKIRHFLYNAFVIENEKIKIAIDPGRNLLWCKLNSLIPKSQWKGVTHVLVTHGDPDHFPYAAKMAKATRAQVICGEELLEELHSKEIEAIQKIDVGEVIDLKEFQVEGIKAVHGPLVVRLLLGLVEIEAVKQVRSHGVIRLLFGLIKLEKDDLDFARGSIGFKINIENKTIVNLGDSLLQKEWEGLRPDLLMIPIGGKVVKNTMDEKEALEAVKLISPKKVIPCHYNASFFWIRNMNPADDQLFKREVEKMGIECIIMKYGDEILV